MKYTLHQLQVFLEVVNQKSVTKASEELFLTQPAVSIQLKKFQDQFPLPLTEVIGRKLYITPFGEEIAEAARNILKEASTIQYKTKQYQGKLAGKLSISVVSTGKYLMPYYLSDFVNNHPEIDFKMDVTNKQKVVRDLEENKTDFALVSVLPNHLELEKLPLLKNSLYLVGASERVNNFKTNVKAIFENEPLLYREGGSATRNAMEVFIKGRNYPVSKKIELTSNEALKQAVIAGLGYSIMPLIGIKNAIDQGDISIIPYKGLPINTQWNLVWLKNKKLTIVADAFLSHLKKEKETIKEKFFDWID
ncbi:MAG: LysR family transcriptional regulator [Flavobacteriaceae bacterium]|nr:LysR family transcriptional regulator [Flavobacteriaceae bacterium]